LIWLRLALQPSRDVWSYESSGFGIAYTLVDEFFPEPAPATRPVPRAFFSANF
jgi:hypothetical protein